MSILDLYNKIPADKQGHLRLGLLIGLAFGSRPLIAICLVTIVAIGKEIYDALYNYFTKTKTHGVEALDALSTFIGGAIGIGIITGIDYLFNYFN